MMINSLFMLGSSFSKNRKVSIVFMLGWLAYIIVNQLYLGLFPIINAIVFLAVTISISLVKNKRANAVLSIFSILIWSIIIDIICYYIYPVFPSNQSVFGYVWQGILFNYKYVFSNMAAICLIYGADIIIERIKISFKQKAVA